MRIARLQAIAKRVDTLRYWVLFRHSRSPLYCLFSPLPSYQCCMKFAMTFNQASLNIKRGRGGLEGYYIVPWPFIVCYLQEIGKMLRVYQPFCNCLYVTFIPEFLTLIFTCKYNKTRSVIHNVIHLCSF